MTRGWSIGSLVDQRARLSEFEAERIFARSYGMAADAAYMTDVEDEVATLRGELFGPQLG